MRRSAGDSASANTRKTLTSGGSDAQSLVAVCGTTDDTSLQTLLQEPKAFSHKAALTTFLDKVHVEIQTNAAMGNDNKEADAHLKALAVYVEMSSPTTILPSGVPVDHVPTAAPHAPAVCSGNHATTSRRSLSGG